MKKYYLCKFNAYRGSEVAKMAFPLLTYTPLFGKTREIPIILIEENGVVLEFFTQTIFECNKSGYSYSFSLPNSSLCYQDYTSYDAFDCREITPAESLKILEPCLKYQDKHAQRINRYFDCFRTEFEQKQVERRRQNKQNEEADKILSSYLKK